MDYMNIIEPGTYHDTSVTVNGNSTVHRTDELGRMGYIDDLDRSTARNGRTKLSGMEIWTRYVKNNSGGTLAPSLAVKWDADYVGTQVDGLAGAADNAAGIVDPYIVGTVPDQAYFLVYFYGPVKVTVNAALAVGAGIACGASGKMAAVSTNPSKGRMLEASAADNDVKRAFVNFSLI